MRKTSAICALALCLGLLTACTGNVPEDSATDLTPVPAASDTDVPVTEAPPETAVPVPDYEDLAAEDCVTDAWPDAPGVMPRLTLDCPGAAEINEKVLADFSQAARDGESDVYYEVYRNGRILSLLMVDYTHVNDLVLYAPYNLDLTTGLTITGPELLALVGQDEAELAQLETAVMGEEFTHQFGLGEDGDEFYRQQYARTTAIANADTERVWLGALGQLWFVGRIYPLAGAECYEYALGSGLFFAG